MELLNLEGIGDKKWHPIKFSSFNPSLKVCGFFCHSFCTLWGNSFWLPNRPFFCHVRHSSSSVKKLFDDHTKIFMSFLAAPML
jgi:hypothetical protein